MEILITKVENESCCTEMVVKKNNFVK